MKPTRATRFLCPSCGQEFNDEGDAFYCCGNVEEGWECSECGEFFQEKEKAKNCCKEDKSGRW